MPKRTDLETILIIGSGPDRHRPGVRVRLLGHAGVPGAARRGLPRGPRELEPGDDHDRSRVRRRHLRRAARRRRASPASSSASAPTRCSRPSAGRPRSTSRSSSHEAGVLERVRRRADRRQRRGHPHRREPPRVQGGDGGDRPRRAALGLRVHARRSDGRSPSRSATRSSSGRRSSSAAAARASPPTPTRCARVAEHGLADQPGVGDPRRAVGRGLEGVRARGDARPRRQRASSSARSRTSTPWACTPATRSPSRPRRRSPTSSTSACATPRSRASGASASTPAGRTSSSR